MQRPTMPGSFVGLVQEDSTLHRRVLLGRVQTYPSRNEVSLFWYKHIRRDMYVFELDGKQWVEPIQALVPVKTPPDKHQHPVSTIQSCQQNQTQTKVNSQYQ